MKCFMDALCSKVGATGTEEKKMKATALPYSPD
jgi:hypothetical protein